MSCNNSYTLTRYREIKQMSIFNEAVQQQQPDWIEYELEQYDIEAINQGGCASGAYMPAVTYYKANKMMAEYGDEVFEMIEEAYQEIPQPPKGTSWTEMAVFYLSIAVELWCHQFDGFNFEEDED